MPAHADARKLDSAAQAHLRKLVVAAVRGGMTQSWAASSFGVSLRAVSKWMKLSREGGQRALQGGQRGRRRGQGRLDSEQLAQLREQVVSAMPEQLGLPFHLWTREAVMGLITRQFGLTVSITTVGRYLADWGMVAQRPVPSADTSQRRWFDQTYPKLARQAKQQSARIYWTGLVGLDGPRLASPNLDTPKPSPPRSATGHAVPLQMLTAHTNRGECGFMIGQGLSSDAAVSEFLTRLLKHAGGRIHLIASANEPMRSMALRRFVAAHAELLQLTVLPAADCVSKQAAPRSARTGRQGSGPRRRSSSADTIKNLRRHLQHR